MLPITGHHACTSFGISSEFHGEKNVAQASAGQDNAVSVNTCRDSSYLIIREAKKDEFGAMAKGPS